MFIIDFDDTLFNTYEFKKARLKALEEVGVKEEVFRQTYAVAYKSVGEKQVYSDKSHAAVLVRFGHDMVKSWEALLRVTEGAREFLFPEAEKFLSALRQTKDKMVLLSLGEKNFQETKLKKSGIGGYFDFTYIADTTKEHVFADVLRHAGADETIWFINDKIPETQKIVSVFPRVRPLMKVSPVFPDDYYAASGFPYFFTLDQMLEHLLSPADK